LRKHIGLLTGERVWLETIRGFQRDGVPRDFFHVKIAHGGAGL
jgi:hypothetical protein